MANFFTEAYNSVVSGSSGDTTQTTDNENTSRTNDSEATDRESEDSDDPVETFADAVRPTLPYEDNNRNQDRYTDEETGDKADDVDARGLFRTPSLNELRYYAREGPYGKTIVNKPVDDAFKHDFDIEGSSNNEKVKEVLENVIPKYKLAKKKSRRDGLCVLMHVVDDSAQSTQEPIPQTGSFNDLKIWTVDHLSDEITDAEVAEHVEGIDTHQVYVTEGREHGGVAIVDDISHPDHGDVIGYGIRERSDSENLHTTEFVHADRCHHFVHGEEVDGLLGNNATGEHVGESVLTPILQPLKAAQMGFYSLSQILLRYSAPLHAVEPPEGWTIEDYDDAREKMGDISMASDAVLPPGAELSVAEGVSEFDPKPYYDVLTQSICAGTVFTKPVLEGTQAGTVSGSETSIKAYFSDINVYRQQDIASDLKGILKKISTYDQSTLPRALKIDEIEFDWGPLFKLNALERAEGAVSLITAATNGIKNYVLTPDEARSLLNEEWATFDIDVDLAELTESQKDGLDRININEAGQGLKDNEPNNRQNPQTSGSQGGRPTGSTGTSSNPTTDSQDTQLAELSEDTLREELQRRESDK